MLTNISNSRIENPSYNIEYYNQVVRNNNGSQMNDQVELSAYYLTMYNISPIQQGIQCLHSTVEYEILYGRHFEYQNWANIWKTVMILNGGTSNAGDFNINEQGSMEMHKSFLIENRIRHACFYEPDLNNALSSICFIVDERMFPKSKKYLSFNDFKMGMQHLSYSEIEAAYMKYMGFVNIEELRLKNWLEPFRLA